MKHFGLRRPNDAVETGHEILVTLDDGRQTVRRTKAMKPLLLEFDEFFTPEECDELIRQRNEKFKNSPDNNRSPSYDLNGDGWVTVGEIRYRLMTDFNSFLKEIDIKGMIQAFLPNIEIVEDHKVRAPELIDRFADDRIVKGYLDKLAKLKPTIKGPNRQVTSFFPEGIIRRLRQTDPARGRILVLPTKTGSNKLIRSTVNRVSHALEVPMAIMNKTVVEVMHYKPNGHPNVHMDSNLRNEKMPCCHRFNGPSRCIVCQWITVLTYLNEPEEGGETVYPVADHEGGDHNERVKELRKDLEHLCENSNIKVIPKKGKALIMYNHFDGKDGEWFGPTDDYSYHGPCPVKKGEKYIQLMAIRVTTDRKFDLTPTVDLKKLLPKQKQKKNGDTV